jgi:capsular polysaccharide biosynthesis protein
MDQGHDDNVFLSRNTQISHRRRVNEERERERESRGISVLQSKGHHL